jgi:4-hydroxybenzoate polyprenyltransferase
MIFVLVWLLRLFVLGKIALVGVAIVAILLSYEHAIVSPKDLRRMNAAFFTLNGIISVVFLVFVAIDVFISR